MPARASPGEDEDEDEDEDDGEEAAGGASRKRKRVDESTELAQAVAKAAAAAVLEAAGEEGEEGEEGEGPKGDGRRRLPARKRQQAQHTNIGHSRSGRSKKLQLVHEDYCFMCDGGGDLICCGQCPKVYHLKCAGLDAVPAGAWTCP
jgi:hypothetical protein